MCIRDSFRIVLDNINILECLDDPFNIGSIITNEDSGVENGSITVSPIGGIAPYTFEWSNLANPMMGAITLNDNLAPGEYTLTITDSNNCSQEETFSIGVVSTADLTDLINFNLFPNPARDIINLDIVLEAPQALEAVSYTHLTLPTIYSV